MTEQWGYVCTFVLILAGLATAGYLLARYLERVEAERQERLRAWARESGWEYITKLAGEPSGCLSAPAWGESGYTHPVLQRFEGFEPFGAGHSKMVYDLLVRNGDRQQYYCFGYHYSTGSGKDKEDHRQVVFAARVPLVFRTMVIKPENFATRMMGFVGLRDIQFESQEFNRLHPAPYFEAPEIRMRGTVEVGL